MSFPENISPRAEIDPARAEEDADGVQSPQAIELAGFLLRAVRRHRLLATTVFAIGGLATVAVVLFAPRAYRVHTKIFAQRQVVMPLLGNPRRTVPSDSDAPLKGVNEIIRRRDNLDAILRETNLLDRWETGRSPILRFKDALVRGVFGPASQEETTRGLLEVLDKKLTVQAEQTTIDISLQWHEPQMAFQISSCLVRNFFKDRSAAESGAITETIAILEEEAAARREAINAAIASVQEGGQATQQEERAVPVRAVRAPSARDSDSERMSIAAALAENHQAIQARQEAGQHRLADLEAQLADLRVSYTPAHPAVIMLEEKIRQAGIEPPALVKLKQTERELLDQAKSFTPKAGPSRGASSERRARAGAPREEDPALATAKAKLLRTVQEYEDLNERIDAARIELRTAEAAFKYRYSVVEPPEAPKKPMNFNVALVALGGAVFSLVASGCAVCARDLASRRFIEPWQARQLPIPLLAEADEP